MMREYINRLFWLVAGVAVSALGITMMLQANIGLEPWSVLQQGLAQTVGITYGTASMIVGAAAIGTAVLCGESFGIGTVVDIVLCAACVDGLLWLDWIPQMHSLLPGVLMLLGGMELLALGTWMYMKSALGAGPRDALMVALAHKTGRSVGLCRASVEIVVIIIGFLLGGQVVPRGHKQDRDVLIHLPDVPGKSKAVCPRHHDIRDDEIIQAVVQLVISVVCGQKPLCCEPAVI